MVVLPALALLAIWLCSLLFLVRIFARSRPWCSNPSVASFRMRR